MKIKYDYKSFEFCIWQTHSCQMWVFPTLSLIGWLTYVMLWKVLSILHKKMLKKSLQRMMPLLKDELKPTGRNLGRVFNFRRCCVYTVKFYYYETKLIAENSAQTTSRFSPVRYRAPSGDGGLLCWKLEYLSDRIYTTFVTTEHDRERNCQQWLD